MSYRTVIVYSRSKDELRRLLQTASLLAKSQKPMHIIGLYVIPTPMIYADTSGFIDATMYENSLNYHQENGAQIKNLFEQEIPQIATSSEFLILRTESDNATQTVNDFGMVADLIIAGQSDPDDPDTHSSSIDQLIFTTKTPVLVVPYRFDVPASLSSVIIAFNGKYEASSAAFDAMPLARQAESVKIIWVNAPLPDITEEDPDFAHDAGITPSQDQDHAPELARRLQEAYIRHGISPEIELIPSNNLSVQDRLRQYIADNKIDVLIMGAYSQSRLKELIFGGVTRSLLANMPCLIFFSR